MKASAIIDNARQILSDTNSVAYGAGELERWLADALSALVLFRPETNTVTAVVELDEGSFQTLPEDAVGLRAILCNVTPDGSGGYDEGRAVRMTERRILDQFDPSWRSQSKAQAVKEFFQDPETPRDFHVYPPNDGTGALKVRIPKVPVLPDLQSNDPELPVQEIYAPALTDWICYRAFIRSDEDTPDHRRGVAHYSRFKEILGVDRKISDETSPQTGEQLT